MAFYHFRGEVLLMGHNPIMTPATQRLFAIADSKDRSLETMREFVQLVRGQIAELDQSIGSYRRQRQHALARDLSPEQTQHYETSAASARAGLGHQDPAHRRYAFWLLVERFNEVLPVDGLLPLIAMETDDDVRRMALLHLARRCPTERKVECSEMVSRIVLAEWEAEAVRLDAYRCLITLQADRKTQSALDVASLDKDVDWAFVREWARLGEKVVVE